MDDGKDERGRGGEEGLVTFKHPLLTYEVLEGLHPQLS